MQKFWAVVNNNQFPMKFQHKHQSLDSARREAGRLAGDKRGEDFMILELVGHCGVPKTPVAFQPAEPPGESVAGDDANDERPADVPY